MTGAVATVSVGVIASVAALAAPVPAELAAVTVNV
jgi:hypothetical protein